MSPPNFTLDIVLKEHRWNGQCPGKVDPSIEAAILDRELPGVLVRLVDALGRVEARGGYLMTAATQREAAWFRRQTDRLAMFLGSRSDPALPVSAPRSARSRSGTT